MIKAIETIYKGYRFRSRLEARWAVFFDALGIAWEYEPEGFDIDGVKYLPDFRLWGSLYCEVKPEKIALSQDDMRKISAFACYHDLMILDGSPDYIAYLNTVYYFSTADDEIIPHCSPAIRKHLPFDIDKINDEIKKREPERYGDIFYGLESRMWWGDSVYDYYIKDDYFGIKDAISKARQARFEHGETP